MASFHHGPMSAENRWLVSFEPVEVTDPLRMICRIFLKLMKKYRKTSTCNRLDLETLGSRPVMLKFFPNTTMDHEVGPWTMGFSQWSDFMVQLPWSDFLPNQFIKFLGPSPGVNRMWTKRNDHAIKSGSNIFPAYVQKWKFGKNKISSLTILLPSLVFICSSFKKNLVIIFICHGPLPLLPGHLFFASPTAKPIGPCRWIM